MSLLPKTNGFDRMFATPALSIRMKPNSTSLPITRRVEVSIQCERALVVLNIPCTQKRSLSTITIAINPLSFPENLPGRRSPDQQTFPINSYSGFYHGKTFKRKRQGSSTGSFNLR